MSIKRAVADITSDEFEQSQKFYSDFLGFDVAMDMGWIMTFASPTNPSAQITLLRPSGGAAPNPQLSIEVTDVAALHTQAMARGLKVVYPLTDEPWGVRRFFVMDPNGLVINVMAHIQ